MSVFSVITMAIIGIAMDTVSVAPCSRPMAEAGTIAMTVLTIAASVAVLRLVGAVIDVVLLSLLLFAATHAVQADDI